MGWPGLSQQEESVLACTIAGLGDKEIAKALQLSLHTVRTYWRRIRVKAGKSTRAEVIAEVSRRRTEKADTGDSVPIGIGRASQVPQSEDERIQRIMDGLSPCIYVALVSIDGHVLYANKAALDIVNLRLDQVIGMELEKTRWLIDTPEAIGQLRHAMELAREGVPSRYESKFISGDGDVVNIDFSLQPVMDQEGVIVHLVPSAQDITERKEVEKELRLTRFAVDHAVGPMLIVDRQANIVSANDAANLALKTAKDVLIGRCICSIDSKVKVEEWTEKWEAFKSRTAVQYEAQYTRPDKTTFPVEVTSTFLSFEQGEYAFVAFRDITEQKEAEERIFHLSHFDSLTGLPNRRLLDERLSHHLAQANKYGLAVRILHVGLDRFRLVNETYGESVGDALLCAVGARITQFVGGVDEVARINGDEFVVVVGGERLDEDPMCAANGVLDAFLEPFLIGEREVYVTCSIGVAAYPVDGETSEKLVKHANIALSIAKDRGGNLAVHYEAKVGCQGPERLRLEGLLRRAVEREELKLHYQPQFDMKTGRIVSLEALMRWEVDEQPIPPSQFIPIAEESGLIHPMQQWVVRNAWQFRQSLKDSFEGRMIVNAARRHFRQDGYVQRLAKLLYEIEADPKCFEVDVTEEMLLEDCERSVKSLEELRSLGMLIALDNFGSAYSSLSYLKIFPIDKLKICRNFIKMITEDVSSAAISEALISLAHRLGIKVVAEGVETKEQRDLLFSLGCDYAQGFYFCHPLPAQEIKKYLEGLKENAVR
jgi:diguanylate cyclase (GGDEF)-like protein/PAS domain S-box-containing protein